jgi:hypothetical protein
LLAFSSDAFSHLNKVLPALLLLLLAISRRLFVRLIAPCVKSLPPSFSDHVVLERVDLLYGLVESHYVLDLFIPVLGVDGHH